MDTTLNRRDFIILGGGALAAAALPSAAEEKKREIKKGIMWGSVPGKMPVADKFRMIKDAGFAGLEIDSGMDRDEVLKARDATGLVIASVVDSQHWGKNLADSNPEIRAAGVEALKVSLHDCKEYGATSVLLVPAVVNKEVSYDQAWNVSRSEIGKVVGLAEELGVKIAIENVWNHFHLSPLEAAQYIDGFHSPALAWHFDIGNVINTGWPEQWIHILGSRIHKLHVKEFSRTKRDQEGLWKGFEVEYLEGDNDWPAVMKALDETGYKGWGTAEPAYWPKGVDVPTRLSQVSAKLDQIFAM